MDITRRQFGMGSCVFLGAPSFTTPRASGQEGGQDLSRSGRIQTIISGDSFLLEDGRTVRLAGIEAPRNALGDSVAQPLFAQARDRLQAFLQEKELSFLNTAPDRFGRVRAHVFAGPDKIWVQEHVLISGLARVRTWIDDRTKAAQMLQLESAARIKRMGIWGRAFYAVRSPEAVRAATGSYQIVEGEVVDASETKKMIYLNFGADWRQDFTAQLTRKTGKVFAKSGIVLAGLSGARIRVRGTIRYNNGPMLWLNHPAQLEILATG